VAEAVAGADLVVLAAPVLALRDLLAAVGPHLTGHALVTDLGSVKAPVLAWAEELLPDPARFVGGHPMAGKERAGIEAAEAALYQGCVWCLTPSANSTEEDIERLERLIVALGAHPRRMEPDAHDAAAATISHLPLVAASALALTAAESPSWPLTRALAAGGFRDTTRVASGDPRMARDICLANREPLLAALDAYLATLHTLRARLAEGDPGVEEEFARAKQVRDSWLSDHEKRH
jgi:prephenate dehydrogenase